MLSRWKRFLCSIMGHKFHEWYQIRENGKTRHRYKCVRCHQTFDYCNIEDIILDKAVKKEAERRLFYGLTGNNKP